MLRYLNKAKDTVQVVTTDVSPDPPAASFSFPIYYTTGAPFAFYPEMIMSTDLLDRRIFGVF